MPNKQLALASMQTLFLDVGNTLLSMNFQRIALAVAEQGLDLNAQQLEIAEIRIRPQFSTLLQNQTNTESLSVFEQYLLLILSQASPTSAVSQLEKLCRAIAPTLRPAGRADLLWNSLYSFTDTTLAKFKQLGLQLIVVSNADGTVADNLRNLGIAHYFDHIIDSHIVGCEKPHRGIFAAALECSQANPSTTLHIGDMYHADVVGAQSAGIEPVLLDPLACWPQDRVYKTASIQTLCESIILARQNSH